MIYTDMTKKALKLSFEAHKNQLDKSGMPYVYHPFHVAEQMESEEETTVALLHDVVEDSQYSIKDIEDMGFSEEVTDALKFLTHDKSVPYMDYVEKLRSNPIATAVKLADLRHNSDLSRVDSVELKDIERVQKYSEAIKLLSGKEPYVVNLRCTCYSDEYRSLRLMIIDGCLNMDSEVYGEDHDSEKHYMFSKEETNKLFSLLSLKAFIELCKNENLVGMTAYLDKNNISCRTVTI